MKATIAVIAKEISELKRRGHKIEITENLVTIYELEDKDQPLRQYNFKFLKQHLKPYGIK